ncbi:hypothetical protein F511_37577 [Dorcoceras hygrometricum]|uniref:Uncharacterized protein n=1 Tax=Dorcoceras hygrometricum TaxID=472368 RepID=A0A2Z7CC57_9LAMI|nr:hypothetical protein F511_37577 [Dorcoceras hygrometricum]
MEKICRIVQLPGIKETIPRKDDRYRRDNKKDERHKREEEDDERTVERSKDKSKDKFKDRSKDRQMKTSNNKRPSRKHDRKVLVAILLLIATDPGKMTDTDETTRRMSDTKERRKMMKELLKGKHQELGRSDSESSSSSSSSSDSEQEEVHCLMADQMDDDEVFDFSNVEFTREDLVQALNDMVHEYKTLSHTFEEIKAENASLKNSSVESSSDELEDTDSLKTELSKMRIENELLRSDSSELKAEVEKLTKEMSSWTQSARAFHKLQEIQKSAHDRTGLGFSNSEISEGETSIQSQPVYDKFNKMGFVKADVIYDCCESIRYDDQKSSQSSHEGKGKDGIGYQRPESSKPSWLKNRLDKDKAKAGSKSYVPNQQRRNFRKAKYDCGRYRQSGPRPDTRLLRHPALEGVMRSARTDSPRRIGRKQISGEEGGGGARRTAAAAA